MIAPDAGVRSASVLEPLTQFGFQINTSPSRSAAPGELHATVFGLAVLILSFGPVSGAAARRPVDVDDCRVSGHLNSPMWRAGTIVYIKITATIYLPPFRFSGAMSAPLTPISAPS
jgi:hypothetical protein